MPHLFESAFKHAAIGMALVGLDGRWLRVNASLCQLIGYTEEELLSRSFQEITHPDDLGRDLDYVRQLLAGKIETYQMEKRYRHKLGHFVWGLLSVSLAQAGDGTPLHFISQVQDITARKEAEQERDLMFNLPLFFRVVFHADGRFQRLSPQWAVVLGYTRKQLLTKSLAELVHPDDLALTMAALSEIVTTNEQRTFQNRLRKANGSHLWLIWSGTGLPERGLGYAVAADVTPIKEAEARALSDAREKHRLYDELRVATKEIRKLQEGLVTVCAWTKQVRDGGQWVTLEEFLSRNLHLKLSHGISEDGIGIMLGEPPVKDEV